MPTSLIAKKAPEPAGVVTAGQHLNCNLCGGEETRVILRGDKKVHAPQHLVIYRYCLRCSFISLDLDYRRWLSTYEEELTPRSDEDLHRYATQEEEETWSVIRDVERFYPEIRNGQGRGMVDVGTGAGGSLRVYQALGWRPAGVECGVRQAAFAREMAGLDVRSERYTKGSFPAAFADLIHCYHTLEHLPQPYGILKNFHRHLKPGGYLYVEVPNVEDTSVYQLGFGHVSLFSSKTLSQSLSACGFQVVNSFDRSHQPTFGIGFLCRKPLNAENSLPSDGEEEFLPLGLMKEWVKDPWIPLRWKLWYAFHIGRGREALGGRACLGLFQAAIKKVVRWR